MKHETFCPNCGTKLKPNEKFCPKCGTKINNSSVKKKIIEAPESTDESKNKVRRTVNTHGVKYIISAVIVIALIVGGAACLTYWVQNHNNHITLNRHSKKSRSRTKALQSKKANNSKSSVNNGGDDLTYDNNPKEDASIIAVYAASKYKGVWRNVVDANDALQVAFKNQNDFSKIDKGNSNVYEVSSNHKASQARYTLDGDGSSKTIYLYDDEDELGSSTEDAMIDYINSHHLANKVKALSNNVELNATLDETDKKDEAASSSAVNYTVPSELQGTWYTKVGNKIEKLQIGAHNVGTNPVRKMPTSIAKVSPAKRPRRYIAWLTMFRYKNPNYKNDLKFYGFKGWCQVAGTFDTYAGHNEMGQRVLICTPEGGPILHNEGSIYWLSPAFAKKYAHKKFKDLVYADDLN